MNITKEHIIAMNVAHDKFTKSVRSFSQSFNKNIPVVITGQQLDELEFRRIYRSLSRAWFVNAGITIGGSAAPLINLVIGGEILFPWMVIAGAVGLILCLSLIFQITKARRTLESKVAVIKKLPDSVLIALICAVWPISFLWLIKWHRMISRWKKESFVAEIMES